MGLVTSAIHALQDQPMPDFVTRPAIGMLVSGARKRLNEASASEAAIARAMAQQAQRIIIQADYSKFGHSSRVSYIKTTDIDTIVTDARARALPGFAALQRAGARLVVG